MTAGVERERAAGVKVGRWGRGHSLASDELQLVKVKATEWPRCTIFCRLLYLEASLPLQQAESLTAHPVHLPSQVCERYGQPNAMFSLKDHTALVTGGTRGIGQSCRHCTRRSRGRCHFGPGTSPQHDGNPQSRAWTNVSLREMQRTKRQQPPSGNWGAELQSLRQTSVLLQR